MSNQTVIRFAPRAQFVSLPNQLTQNRALSFEARGMMAYLLSKPSDWTLQPEDLQQQCGRDKVYKILKELIDACYIRREWLLDDKKRRIGIVYTVYQEPYPDLPDTALPDPANTDITKYREEQKTDSKGEPPKTVRLRNGAHDWIVTDVLHAGLDQADEDKTLHSLASKLLTSVLIAERRRRGLPPGAPLKYAVQNEIAGHLPGLKAFWLKQHPGLGDSDFPSTPPAFSKVVGQWYAAGCPNGAKPERDPLAAPPMLYDPACPHGCDHGTVHYPDGTSGPCVCQVRIVSELRGTV